LDDLVEEDDWIREQMLQEAFEAHLEANGLHHREVIELN
jgi:hypothetical protein